MLEGKDAEDETAGREATDIHEQNAIRQGKEPAQKPGRSKQDYETPVDFLDAVERRFGAFEWDLAASKENKKADGYYDEGMDSLKQPWAEVIKCAVGWLNPPFADLGAWAEKCAAESKRMHPRGIITMLCPASVGTNWWASHVDGSAAEVLFLSPRISFVGTSAPYPKDLSLIVYRGETAGGTMYRPWRWKP